MRAIKTAAIGAVFVAGTAACGSGGSSVTPSAAAHVADVTITSSTGCDVSSKKLAAGTVTFNVNNESAPAVSEVELQSGERIVGERENLPPGFKGSFTVNIDAGSYNLYCPGAAQENIPLTVTGKSSVQAGSTAQVLRTGAKDYAAYITAQVGYLVSGVKNLKSEIASGDLTNAQDAYMKARPYYEKIEPVAESFTVGKNNLDNDIDARINNVPLSQWEGFHRIERSLFLYKTTKGISGYATGLVKNVEKLQRLTTGLTYRPFELANGAQDLLDEVATSKITGEEERYSHIDLLDFEANDEGAEQAFADLQPGLDKIDKSLATEIAARFMALDTLVDKYRTGSNDSGFEFYGALDANDKRILAAAVKSVQEPLSQVAGKVASS